MLVKDLIKLLKTFDMKATVLVELNQSHPMYATVLDAETLVTEDKLNDEIVEDEKVVVLSTSKYYDYKPVAYNKEKFGGETY